MSMPCKLTRYQVISRFQKKLFTGPTVVIGVGSSNNFAWASSDVVPNDRYRAIFAASALFDTNGADQTNQSAGLWLLSPGSPIPPNANQGPYIQYPLFLSHSGGVGPSSQFGNGPPVDPSYGIRIDDTVSDDVGTPTGLATPFSELTLLRQKKPFIVPPGHSLLAYNGVAQAAGFLHVILTLKILYAEFQFTEDFDW